MVLAAMANPPEHDFAPSWLKIPSDQQKRGKKLGASSATTSDQWSGNSKPSNHDDAGHNKSRHRHYSSSDSPTSSTSSSHQSSDGGYGGRSSSGTSAGGSQQGSYGYRGRETDRRHYPRPGSGSRHHSVDDLNGYHDYGGGWNLPQYNDGFYSNYPRRGGSAIGLRDSYGGNSRYGDVFHPPSSGGGRGRGYYDNGSRGNSAGRQRYNSGSRAGYNDRDNHHPDGNDSSEGSGKKKDGTEQDSKKSALSSNDFPSLLGDNSKTSAKVGVTSGSKPGGVWDKPPGANKVQISGRKVQLIKKSIHNDLPPRDPTPSSSIKSSSSINPEGSKVSSGGHPGSGTQVNRSVSSGSAAPPSSSSSNGGYKSSIASSQKSSAPVKAHPDPPCSSSFSSFFPSHHKPSNKDPSLSHSPKSSYHAPSKPSNDVVPPKPHPHHPPPHHSNQAKPYEKKAIDVAGNPTKMPAASNADVSNMPKTSTVVMAKNSINKLHEGAYISPRKDTVSKAGPGMQYQASIDAKLRAIRCAKTDPMATPTNQKPAAKPVLVQTATTVASKVGGKVSSTKPVLVQTVTTVASKVDGKLSSTKPVLVQTVTTVASKVGGKVSPTKPVLVQTATTVASKVGGKVSPTKPVLVQTATTVASKVGGKVSPTKPVLVQTATTMASKNGGKVSPTKPVLVQTATTVASKVGSKVSPTKPVLVQTATTVASKVGGKVSPTKPVLVQSATTVASKVGGKVSPTKPVLVQTSTTVPSKPTIKQMTIKNTNGKPVLKDSPIRPVPIQMKSTNSAKFSGKESPVRSFPGRMTNQKQGNRSVRPGPVQIRSNRLVAKETPTVRPVPVHIMSSRKPSAANDNPSDADTMATRLTTSSVGFKEKHSSVVKVNTALAKEPSTIPTSTPPMDIRNKRYSHNMNVNNSDSNKDTCTHLQNGEDSWSLNGPLRIEDANKMNGPTMNERDTSDHITTNGLDNDHHKGMANLQLSSSLEAEKRLLQEMGWHEHSDNEEGYAPITEDEMKEFQRRSQQLKTQRNGFTRNIPVAVLSSSLPNTPMTSIDLDDALSSCSSDSSDDDL